MINICYVSIVTAKGMQMSSFTRHVAIQWRFRKIELDLTRTSRGAGEWYLKPTAAGGTELEQW